MFRIIAPVVFNVVTLINRSSMKLSKIDKATIESAQSLTAMLFNNATPVNKGEGG